MARKDAFQNAIACCVSNGIFQNAAFWRTRITIISPSSAPKTLVYGTLFCPNSPSKSASLWKMSSSSSRVLKNILRLKSGPVSSSSSACSSGSPATRFAGGRIAPSQHRSIATTTPLRGWMDSIKGVFTGKKDTPLEESNLTAESFTLLRFADELKNARRLGKFKQYIVGRSSEATFADAFEKQEAIIRYLGGLDTTGENLQTGQKQEAAKQCNCTVADVENALSKFTWARQANKKMTELKEQGKPLPKNIGELQKVMGSTPLDVARSNLAKSGQISRNALCPCGSKKRYKRCCGKD
ncbi:PREDICTED: uncharacterized protein LOC104818652 [Tarenaya hassleriana]|uniref:uncharacterized protein LOC104818652 n=1 Tax=Tarenaya hassleriana TaxID=28532 RepID=UPI00053C7BEA|nr:PREDICTED: uncharacterized protein LOC104818652 [Tarenaya hassleriana]